MPTTEPAPPGKTPPREGFPIKEIVDSDFQTAFHAAIFDIRSHGSRQCEAYTLLRGDSRVQVENAP